MPLANLRRSFRWLILAGFAAGLPQVSAAEEAKLLPVPSVTIYPGDSIRESLLVDRDFSTNTVVFKAGMIETHAALVGKIARRTLLPGLPIPGNAVAEKRLISNGEKVKIIFAEEGLTITSYGSALQSGGAGDIVSVRNLDSGLTISGVVQSDGSVRVSGGG